MWQPIDTAPENVVILTDKGTAIKTYLYGYHLNRPKTSWYLCDADGNVPV